jgi:hypothetical protein
MTEKDKKQMMVVLILLPVLGLLFFLNASKKGGFKSVATQSSSTDSGSVSEIISAFDSNVKLIADKEINDGLERVLTEKVMEGWERNPFEILVSTKNMTDVLEAQEAIQKLNVPSFTVSGIVYDDNPANIAVIINGDFYKLDDKVDGWEIINVASDSVYFKRGETEFIFNLYEK